MGIREQWKTVQENWLIALLLLVLVLLPLLGGRGIIPTASFESMTVEAVERSVAGVAGGYYPSPIYQDDFAPEVKERKITKNAFLSTEVARGGFWQADAQLKAMVTAADAFLLNENTYKSGPGGRKSYYTGSYQLKVESSKYDAVISQLREIGEIQSFNENVQDITGTFEELETQLEAEKARLVRYKQLLSEAATVDEKLQLTDRIFELERTIRYLEEAVRTFDRQVAYSTISVTIQEKQSGYAGIVVVGFSELVARLVNGLNGLLTLLFWLVPYALIIVIAWFVVRKVRKK